MTSKLVEHVRTFAMGAGLLAVIGCSAAPGRASSDPSEPEPATSPTAASEKDTNLLLLGTGLSPGFSSTGPIYSVRADGTDKTLLANEGGTASWTPDGRILFVSQRSGTMQIWMMDADGSNAEQLGNLPANTVPLSPQMAKNGLIAFMGGDSSGMSDGNTGIWIMQKDGSGLEELVRGQEPFLAPSGTWLAYVRQSSTPDGAGNSFSREVWRIDTDGSANRALTFVGDVDYADANAPAISPDEKTIAVFSGKEDSGDPDILHIGHRNVAIIPATGGPRVTLTPCTPPANQDDLNSRTVASQRCFAADNPSWTPDGQWLIFDVGFIDGLQTWMVDSNGHGFQPFYPALRGIERVPLKRL